MAAGFIDFVRKFAKGPLTQVAYSAGMVGIRKSVKRGAIASFYEELARAGHDMLVEGMTEQEQMEVTAAAIAQVIYRFRTVSYNVHNETSAWKPDFVKKEIRSVEDFAADLLSRADSLQDLIFFRRNYSTSKFMFDPKTGDKIKKWELLQLDEKSVEDFANGIDLIYGHSLQAALEDKLKIKAGETTDDLSFTLETVRCVGCCATGPVITVNQETHGGLDRSGAVRLIEEYAEEVLQQEG